MHRVVTPKKLFFFLGTGGQEHTQRGSSHEGTGEGRDERERGSRSERARVRVAVRVAVREIESKK